MVSNAKVAVLSRSSAPRELRVKLEVSRTTTCTARRILPKNLIVAPNANKRKSLLTIILGRRSSP